MARGPEVGLSAPGDAQVSRHDALSLARCLERLTAALQAEILPSIEQHFARNSGVPTGDLVGEGRRLINEAQVRRYVIDPVLVALGWNLEAPTSTLVEAGVEATVANGHRRFLDYFGLGSIDEARALLFVEAKRLSVVLPAHDAGMDPRDVIAAALREAFSVREPGTPGGTGWALSEEWRGILTTLADYVRRLAASEHGVPRRVLLTNGEWFVVFLNPTRSFLDRVGAANDLIVVSSLEKAVEMARELYSSLSHESLADHLPVQNCVDLRRFVQAEGEPLPAIFAVEVSTGEIGGVRPVMGFHPSVAVQVPSGAWVRFADPASGPQVLRDEDELDADMAEISRRSDSLLSELRAQRALRLIDASSYEASEARIPKFPSTTLLRRETPSRFVLHIGDRSTPFVSPGAFEGCPYHAHGPAFQEGRAASETAILRPSTNPPAYFPSGSPHHCAHRTVHILRAQRCAIRMLDEYLCCRSCVLQHRCWPEGFREFPCVECASEEVDVRDAGRERTFDPKSRS